MGAAATDDGVKDTLARVRKQEAGRRNRAFTTVAEHEVLCYYQQKLLLCYATFVKRITAGGGAGKCESAEAHAAADGHHLHSEILGQPVTRSKGARGWDGGVIKKHLHGDLYVMQLGTEGDGLGQQQAKRSPRDHERSASQVLADDTKSLMYKRRAIGKILDRRMVGKGKGGGPGRLEVLVRWRSMIEPDSWEDSQRLGLTPEETRPRVEAMQ